MFVPVLAGLAGLAAMCSNPPKQRKRKNPSAGKRRAASSRRIVAKAVNAWRLKKPGRHAMVAANRSGNSIKAASAILKDQIRRFRRNPTNIDHAAYQAKVRTLSDAALHYAIRDASAAIKAHPTGHKAGYYQDEIHYCAAELRRRGHRSNPETNPRRKGSRRVRVDEAASRLAWWRWHHNPPKTRSEYVAMVESWPRKEILRCFRAAGISAQNIKTNRELAERMWERIGKAASERSNPPSRYLSRVIAALNNPRRRRSRK
jgi:hypothetical protein